jgi:ankyrin repeat protein
MELLKLLLDEGADTQINLSNRMMALHLAVTKSSIEMVSLLLDRGAKVNVQDQDGNTPLYLAAKNNNLELATLLVDRGAEIDTRSVFVKEGSKVAKYLAQVAANALPNDRENESSLHTDADFENILLVETIFYQINIQFSSKTTSKYLYTRAVINKQNQQVY